VFRSRTGGSRAASTLKGSLVFSVRGDHVVDVRAALPVEEVQRQVDARGDAAGGHDVAVVDDPLLADLGVRRPEVVERAETEDSGVTAFGFASMRCEGRGGVETRINRYSR
jgi:hypothetical protein